MVKQRANLLKFSQTAQHIFKTNILEYCVQVLNQFRITSASEHTEIYCSSSQSSVI